MNSDFINSAKSSSLRRGTLSVCVLAVILALGALPAWAHGGVVVEAVHPDSPGSACWIATFRDPAGNLIGLYQEGPR